MLFQTGECICKPGYEGPTCEDTCTPGYFGEKCANRCKCEDTNSECHHVTGECIHNCPAGRMGRKCNQSKMCCLCQSVFLCIGCIRTEYHIQEPFLVLTLYLKNLMSCETKNRARYQKSSEISKFSYAARSKKICICASLFHA